MPLATLKGDQTLVQLVERFDVHANQAAHWKAQLLERAADVFATGRGSAEDTVNINELHANIGQLALKNDFFGQRARAIARSARNTAIDREHDLSLIRQAELLRLSRASLYHRPKPALWRGLFKFRFNFP